MKSFCNRCRQSIPEFAGTMFINGKVYHRYQCLCGNREDMEVSPFGYDLDDPRAQRTIRMTQDYAERMRGIND